MSTKEKENSLEQDFLSRNVFGKDILHIAISSGNDDDFKSIMRSVKENGLSLSGKDYLSWAVHYGHYGYISPLICAGCTPYLSSGHGTSILDYALSTRNRLLFIEIINACQRLPNLMKSELLGDKKLLAKQYSTMTGKERIIALIMVVVMDFDELSFYVTEATPIIAYSIYNDVKLRSLALKTEHEHVRDIIKSLY